LDADKEGFLRSDTSLIQTMGRAARHILGEVVMYADKVTDSMKRAIAEVDRRRKIQEEYNIWHEITPENISKPFRERLVDDEIEEDPDSKGKKSLTDVDYQQLPPQELKKAVKILEKEMVYEAEMLNFEKAAVLRDKVREIKRTI